MSIELIKELIIETMDKEDIEELFASIYDDERNYDLEILSMVDIPIKRDLDKVVGGIIAIDNKNDVKAIIKLIDTLYDQIGVLTDRVVDLKEND